MASGHAWWRTRPGPANSTSGVFGPIFLMAAVRKPFGVGS